MTFAFKPAVRENVGLLIGLAGASGSGKTFSAMELAAGIAGDKPFAVIDTEARRALHYADRFKFDHGDLRPPFRPRAYAEAIEAADKSGYPVIVVDSASHEHAGEGGILDMHEELLDQFCARDKSGRPEWQVREANNMRAWIEPKTEHKAFVQKLLQLRAHLILCFRAEPKVEMAKDDKGKTVIRPKESPIGADGYMPVAEKNLPYELTASFLLRAGHPGYPIPIKLQEQHRPLFPLDRPLGRESGKRIAEWSAGGDAPRATPASLGDVLRGFKLCETVEQLDKMAKQHAAQLTGDDKAKAQDAYKARKDEIKGSAS